MENLEIIINEMMADDGTGTNGPKEMSVRTSAKKTQSVSDTSNDMSYEDVCAIAWKGYKAGKGSRQERTKRNRRVAVVAKELMNGRVAERDDGGKKGGKKGSKGSKRDCYGGKKEEVRRARKAANFTGTVTGTKEALETKCKGKGKSETRYWYDCGEEGHIGVNCPYKWTQQHRRRR